MKIAFIGGGNMGEAMLAAVLARALAQPESISVSDVSHKRLEHLKKQYSVTVTPDNPEAISDKDIIILAVKPQNLAEVMAELKDNLNPAQLILSIIAGAKISTIFLGLTHNAVVRAMPNAPARVGEGMSVWTATSDVTDQQKQAAKSILGAMGRELYVDDEAYLDMATAISGSGPAYFFLMVEALVDAAIEIGLPREMAQELVLQTMLGSGKFIRQSGASPAELRRKVTSPGGTTAAALAQFEKGGFGGLVRRAVKAAYERAKELGK
ncbi:MAG: pyrroline-5-carboxylate reductase [Dehalococcoidales bacterium]|jgi:pyrroline-5-carboxylate reductase|nr:pyrroline-5-carboxylate reductase [Dehalococcoidales bacterium]